jgi:hypothetical protein
LAVRAPEPDSRVETLIRDRTRRRLWQLPSRHHCVLLGAAFDVRELRQLFRRAGSRDYAGASDYELHSSAVHFAGEKNAFSLRAQRLLDERFRDAVLRFDEAATPRGLLERWRSCAERGEAVSAYWAALTHPACDPALDETLGLEMHMAAHHAFAERRAAARRIRDLHEQVAQRDASLAAARGRLHALKRGTARLREDAAAAEGKLREARRERDACRAELERWSSGEETAALQARIRSLTEDLAASQSAERAAARALRQAQRPSVAPLPEVPAGAPAPEVMNEADLARRRVLCVGGKTSLVPHYREIVERARGEFVHHDGGIEHHLGRLPALLSAADAVVCLAADCSHSAYRLAKRYCKAKGKPCALLATSSVHALSSCIQRLSPSIASNAAA